ncbi:MAG: hypothetical protein KKB09_07225 [Nanoarchaeota archaeon]|nr:hypothetical protein [Nanoarchaeota archaeon]
MEETERKFQISKNKLDNEYQKTLSYLNVKFAGVLAIVIGVMIFFMEQGDLLSAMRFIVIGIFAITWVIYDHEKQLKQITLEIEKLSHVIK